MSRDQRRRQLLDVAIRLFAQQGFAGTTTRAIAQAAGVTEAVIFQHFATKDDLYRAVIAHKASVWGNEAAMAQIRNIASARDDEGFFRFLLTETLRVMREDRDFARLLLLSAIQGSETEFLRLFNDMLRGPKHTLIRAYIAQRQQEGAFRACDIEAAILALDGMVIHFGMLRYLMGAEEICGEIQDDEMIHRFVRIFLEGLRTGNSSARTRARSQRKSQ
jgi:TetR/AcrR family transcriptional regulator